MSPSGMPAHDQYLDFEQQDLGLEALSHPPVAFRESWRVIPLPRERNMVTSLLCHWTNLAGKDSRPSIGTLDPEVLPVEWCSCALLRRKRNEDWSLEYQGENFLEPGCGDFVPQVSSLQNRMARWFDMALQAGRPFTVGGGFRQPDGRQKRFRALLLPFGDAGGKVTHLLAASTARDLLSLAPHHLPVEAHVYVDGFWVRQAALP